METRSILEKGNRHLKRKACSRGGVARTRGLSREQVSILVARDRNKSTLAQVATFGRLNASRVTLFDENQ